MTPIREKRWRRLKAGLALTTALCGICALGSPASAVVEVDPFTLSPEELFDATVITVSKTPESVRDAPAAIYVLSSEDIVRSGATSIPEALRLVPGVQVARVNSAGWAISVRGFNSALANKLLVLIDGRVVYDPLYSGVYWDVQDTPLDDIERIEVIRGPGASLWGANAVNGVINIITKKASETAGWLINLTAGNEDRAQITARYGGTVGENLHWRVYGKYLDHATDETPFGTNAEDDWAAWRGGFRADWDPNTQGDTFTVQGDIYRSDSGQMRSVPELTPPYAIAQHENISVYGGNLLGRWTRELGDDSRFTIQSYVDLTTRDQLTLGTRRNTVDFDAQYDFPMWKQNKLTVGAEYRDSIDHLSFTPIITGVGTSYDEQLFSGFAQDKITLVPDQWFLTLGSKFEHNDFTGLEIQPNARLQWDDGDLQTVWTSVARAARTPTDLERNLTISTGVIPPGIIPLPVSVILQPSPAFSSEQLIAYEAGYRRQWTPSVQMDISTFYNDYDKLSTLSLMAPQVVGNPLHIVLPIATTNLTTAKTYGFEAVLNWRAADNIKFSAVYSLLDMQLDGPPSNAAIASEGAKGQSPRNQFNVRSQWDVSSDVALDTTIYYVDALPGYNVHAYWRLDARLGWRLTSKLEFDVVGQNLLSDSHREFGAITDANAVVIGRGIYGKLLWRP